MECFAALRELLPPEFIRFERHAPWPELVLFNGSRLEVRSAQFPAHLRGAGLDWLVLDEAAHLREESWITVYPTTSDRRGRIILVSTPHGRNWFYGEWRKVERHEPDYAGWRRRGARLVPDALPGGHDDCVFAGAGHDPPLQRGCVRG